ncbi:MAG TPA: proline racemase family protein [Thermoanaerobaculia bacterium]|nr:proline racemase family protein [Thermoanaerobaculia bacterium]
MQRVRVLDSHTAGEPTRVILEGGPDLGRGGLAARRERFRSDFDAFRSAVVNEPRGSDALVGALLCEPVDPANAAGVIYFDNVGYLGMCGHGTIGVVTTLAALGRLAPGRHRLETPVGVIPVELYADGRVSVHNVRSWRHRHGVTLDVPGYGPVTGDVAWGGNWFFLVKEDSVPIDLQHLEALTAFAWAIRLALEGVTGPCGEPIDHIALFAAAPGADSRDFVLCPGKAYDRSPCGTGTSAKLACLAADGQLAPGEIWVQESVLGSRFEASYQPSPEGGILPVITGRAHLMAESTLLLDETDPFCWGIPTALTGDRR